MNYANWRIEDEIAKRVELESWAEWAQKPIPPLVNNYKPTKLGLTQATIQAFASSFHFISSIPKL
jgi:hypothetical protein